MHINKKNTLSKLKEKERDSRRRIILDAAEKEFATKHFTKVNMRDIAKRAGMSPALIYRHFPDQQALFMEAFLQGVTDGFETMYRTIDASQDGSISEITKNFIGFFTLHNQYYRMMMNFFLDSSVYPDVSSMLNALERSILEHFDTMFHKMNIRGDIRSYSYTLLAALIGIIAMYRRKPEQNVDETMKRNETIAENLAHIFIEMAGR